MVNRTIAALVASAFLGLQCVAGPALADNQMGYRELSARQAASLPRRGGALGMDIGPSQQINEGGLAFEMLRVKGVRPGSPGAQAGFDVGDQIIAVDGQVFPSVAAFAAYVGSLEPGRQLSVDYIPKGGGPQQAQRIGVTVGDAGRAVAPRQDAQAAPGGLSTGAKVAIGVGAAALFGCYKLGCFSKLKSMRGAPAR